MYQISIPTFDYQATQIESTCKQEQQRIKKKLERIGSVGSESCFRNSALALEQAMTDLQQTLSPLIFMKYVSNKPEVRKAADHCETTIEQMRVEIFAREDLYGALKTASSKKEPLEPSDKKLLDEFLREFRRNGLELAADKRKVFVDKKKRLVELESEYSKELIEWNDWVEFSREQLGGLPDSFVQRLAKTPQGKFKVTVKYPDYYPFMENATHAEARRLLEEKFYRRGGEKNLRRLDEALRLRNETAQMLGFPNHAAFILDDRMAKTPQMVAAFLERVGRKIQAKVRENLEDLLQAKREDLKDKTLKDIYSHDWRYYENQIKKRKHNLDTQAIKEYFPLDVVTQGMFEIYQTLLSVSFEPAKDLPTWHPSAAPYRVKRDGKTVAIFYMDLFPRDGKYGHAAAFTIIQGYKHENGSYETPISSIVANFNPPSGNSPSLLEHGEVETLFHEFGHIMHQVLTTAHHATFSGTSVKRDFVEAPSQMLENWVWETSTLAKLSGHYKDHSKPLPADQVKRLVDAKLLNVGIKYARQILFATLDQRYHAAPPQDSTALYFELAKEIMLVPMPPGTIPQAGFGHLMGGYDAGYYGYLWSEVYAQDMFTRFEKEGLLNAKTGQDYLKWILQPGGELEPMELIKHFLGREPNEEAFFRSLGL